MTPTTGMMGMGNDLARCVAVSAGQDEEQTGSAVLLLVCPSIAALEYERDRGGRMIAPTTNTAPGPTRSRSFGAWPGSLPEGASRRARGVSAARTICHWQIVRPERPARERRAGWQHVRRVSNQARKRCALQFISVIATPSTCKECHVQENPDRQPG
jgi:hypothetical protein